MKAGVVSFSQIAAHGGRLDAEFHLALAQAAKTLPASITNEDAANLLRPLAANMPPEVRNLLSPFRTRQTGTLSREEAVRIVEEHPRASLCLLGDALARWKEKLEAQKASITSQEDAISAIEGVLPPRRPRSP